MGNQHSYGKKRGTKMGRSVSSPDETDFATSNQMDLHMDLIKVAEKWAQLSTSLVQIGGETEDLTVDEGITRSALEHQFHVDGVPFLGTLLFQHFQSSTPTNQRHKNPDVLTQKAFVSNIQKTLQLNRDEEQAEFYFKVFSKGSDRLSDDDLCLLLTLCVKVACTATGLSKLISDADQQVFHALTRSLDVDSAGGIDSSQFNFWVQQNGVHLLNYLHHFVTQTLISCSGIPNEQISALVGSHTEEDMLPILDQENEKCLQLNSMALLWLLCSALPRCYIKRSPRTVDGLSATCRGLPSVGSFASQLSPVSSGSSVSFGRSFSTSPSFTTMNPQQFIQQLVEASNLTTWTLLYNSEKHGLCMNRFLHHTLHYSGPTLSIYRLESGSTFCVAVDSEWREDSIRWGGSDCVIYQLQPQFKRLECGANLIYLNEHSRGVDHGIQFGKDPERPILKVGSNMHDVVTAGKKDQLACVEVWGCAGSGPKQAQIQHIRWENKQAEKNQRIMRPNKGDWKESTDKFLIDLVKPNRYAD